jgi:hypothetical protein
MDSKKSKRPPNFRLEIPGDEHLKNRGNSLQSQKIFKIA